MAEEEEGEEEGEGGLKPHLEAQKKGGGGKVAEVERALLSPRGEQQGSRHGGGDGGG